MSDLYKYATAQTNTTIEDCILIRLPQIAMPEGSITPVHKGSILPFDIARVYFLYDVPGGAARGGHAHRQLQQLMVAAMGCYDVVLDDGEHRKTVRLDRAYNGLYIPRFIWRELINFSSGGICLVVASLPYDENDYISNYSQFLKEKYASTLP